MTQHRDAPWQVVHLLNSCASSDSALYREGLINFFLDDPVEYSALVLVPGTRLQQRLVQEFADTGLQAMFEPPYDMLANPRSLRAQNSNQWLLETLASAQSAPRAVDSRDVAQQWLFAHGFKADAVSVTTLDRPGARLFRANVEFTDQPLRELQAGRVQVVTVRVLEHYLQAHEPQLRRHIVTAQ